jgi:site-specific DNA-methyltransferase (adenine-specific)
MTTQQPIIFNKGDDTVYWGEVSQVLSEYIPDASIPLIFADPPYNIGKEFASFDDRWPTDEAYAEWCYRWLELCIAKLSANGSMYVMGSTQSMPYIDLFLRTHLHILSRIVWHYDSSGVQARKYYGSLYEPILFCVKDRTNYTFNAEDIKIEAKTGAQRRLIDYRKPIPSLYNTSKVPGNVWFFPRVRYRMPEYENHPSQKPEALLERIVKASSNAGDTVLDLFSGTFTTSAVAQRRGRKTIGIECEEEYIKIGLRRLGIQQQLNGEPLQPPRKSYRRKSRKTPDTPKLL